MKLLTIWVVFTVYIGFLKCNSAHYIVVSIIMLYITKVYNKIEPTKISLKQAVLLSFIPNTIILYLAYKCNDFLWVNPYSWPIFISIFCLYSYILIYIAIEC